jgi:hypothetical protein
MPKNKISEFSSTPANNTDIGGIDIAEGCAPSGINNAIRELMAQLKDQQAGTDADSFTVGGNLIVTGTSTFNGGGIIPSGGIIIWSGSSGSIPSGWLLCNGTSGTPNLLDRFVVGAGSTYAVAATGGNANATLVSHEHTFNGNTGGQSQGHSHSYTTLLSQVDTDRGGASSLWSIDNNGTYQTGANSNDHVHNYSGTTTTVGASATNANLPPYYALCYIMKA